MSGGADVLRRAAVLMRSRAEAASTGPYIAAEQVHDQWYGLQTPFAAIGNVFDCHDAAHIASWHPAVALAVADWLDDAAENVALSPALGFDMRIHIATNYALAVARAYLGES